MPIRDTPQNFPFCRISLCYYNSGGIGRSEGTLVIKVQVPGVDINKLSHFQRRLGGGGGGFIRDISEKFTRSPQYQDDNGTATKWMPTV